MPGVEWRQWSEGGRKIGAPPPPDGNMMHYLTYVVLPELMEVSERTKVHIGKVFYQEGSYIRVAGVCGSQLMGDMIFFAYGTCYYRRCACFYEKDMSEWREVEYPVEVWNALADCAELPQNIYNNLTMQWRPRNFEREDIYHDKKYLYHNND